MQIKCMDVKAAAAAAENSKLTKIKIQILQ